MELILIEVQVHVNVKGEATLSVAMQQCKHWKDLKGVYNVHVNYMVNIRATPHIIELLNWNLYEVKYICVECFWSTNTNK